MSTSLRTAPVPPPVPNSANETVVGQLPQDLLQMKYLTVDRNYETLKHLTRKGKGCSLSIVSSASVHYVTPRASELSCQAYSLAGVHSSE